MRKYLWGIIAGVCVVALLAVVGIIFIPKLFDRGQPSEVPEGHEIVMPAYWWKAEMTEQQLATLAALWGKDITAAQLLEELWPDVLQQMPQEAATAYEKQQARWPTEKYQDWKGEFICGGIASPHEEGTRLYHYYLGDPRIEEGTLLQSVDRGFTADRIYRVSLYTGVGLE